MGLFDKFKEITEQMNPQHALVCSFIYMIVAYGAVVR